MHRRNAIVSAACLFAPSLLLAGAATGIDVNATTCPTTQSETMYFTTDVNWSCDANFDCLIAYGDCVNGTLQSNMSVVVKIGTETSVLQRCLGARATCVLNAALNSGCNGALKGAYPWFYSASNRTTTNVTTACVAGLCAELAGQSVSLSVSALNVACSFPNFTFPRPGNNNNSGGNGGNGGGDGLPQSPNCPNNTNSYFTNKPKNENCTAELVCETQWCNCNSFPLRSEHDCEFNVSALNQTTFERCAPQYMRCMANASLAMYVPNANTNSNTMTCASWSSWLVSDYANYYYSSQKASSSLVNACASLACNVEMYAFNHTGDVANLCLNAFSGLPTPPYNPNNNGGGNGGNGGQCMEQGTKLFDKLPAATCASVELCVRNLCSCVNGTYQGAGECKFPTNPAVAVMQRCMTTALNCVVNTALALYVPGTDATNPTVDACVRWSVPIAAAYKEYTTATNKQTTALYATCNATACKTLGDVSLLAATCAFSSVTAAATYQPPNACPFSCPDTTCARYLANCTCVANANLYNVSAQFVRALTSFDVTNPLSGLGFGTYRVLSGNCSTYDFNPYMRFGWVLSNSTNANVYSVNGSGVNVPALSMVPGATYTLTLTVRGLLDVTVTSVPWTITTVAPTPIVTITRNGAALRVSNGAATVLPAYVVDPFPGSSPTFIWACSVVSGSNACPSLTNQTIARLVIAAEAATGTFTFTFTYKAVSSSVNVTIVAGSIPTVRIVQTSVPVVAVPALYLPTQAVILTSVVTGGFANLTYSWTVNGVAAGSGKSFAVNASTLTASTAAQLTAATPVANTIVVRASVASDVSVYGESTIVVVVAPAYSLTVTVKKASDLSATSATGLTDTLQLTVTTDLASPAPYGLSSSYAFTFVADSTRPLKTVPTSVSTVATTQAPMPYSTTTGAVTVTFGAQLLLGGKVVSSATTTFSIVKPDPAAAAASQIAQVAAITDPTAAVAAAANIQTLMQTTTDPDTKKQLAVAAVALLANSVTDFSSQSPQQQAAIFETLSTAVGATSDATQLAEMKAKTLSLMTNALSSTSFDPANGATALTALASVGVKDSQAVISSLASIMANDPTLPVGEVRTLEAPGVVIATRKQSASSLGGVSVAGGTSTLSIAAGFTLPGVSDDSVVSIAQATYTTNPFGSNNGQNPNGGISSIDFNVDGSVANVTGLTTPLEIGLSGVCGSSVCRYWDEDQLVWSAAGVTTVIVNGVVTCRTTHLTAFASFGAVVRSGRCRVCCRGPRGAADPGRCVGTERCRRTFFTCRLMYVTFCCCL
ncbi:transmembrane protein, putative [Bodo saltans]|uniref:Transmembrane protein, putative n=1 Tax=Bodo saltans TaxID=75058 RepID=A0A0S4JQK0_BODSA|nr:transmembrane protein, putative [Bodo saltans]|eukprot:CUG93792.1 transmembrane protein, putative [Bodo saltans]